MYSLPRTTMPPMMAHESAIMASPPVLYIRASTWLGPQHNVNLKSSIWMPFDKITRVAHVVVVLLDVT